jgi:DNA-binding response OmpR family regulator
VNAHILIIEDEEDILELQEYHLSKEGYEVTGFLNTRKVEEFLEDESVDLLIVDRNLPSVEGSEFVASLRSKGYDIPVIFVSAKDSDSDIEEGFLRGGDDYLTKPFNVNELLLRVRSILKRTQKNLQDKVTYKDIVLDLAKREAYVSDVVVNLSKMEFELLSYFIKNKNRVIDRYELLERVWLDEDHTQTKTVNVTINRLLKKIDPKKSKKYIEPVRGVGYKLC